MTPPFISVDCLTYDVRPIAPDPVENLQITFQQALPQSDRSGSGTIDRIFITLRYTWIAPEFVGEGITGYQAWLAKEPTPERGIIAIGNLHQIGPNATSDELRTVFNESDTNFTLYFQVRIYFSRLTYVCMCTHVFIYRFVQSVLTHWGIGVRQWFLMCKVSHNYIQHMYAHNTAAQPDKKVGHDYI